MTGLVHPSFSSLTRTAVLTRIALLTISAVVTALGALALIGAAVHDDLGTTWPADATAVAVLCAGVLGARTALRPARALVVVLLLPPVAAGILRALPPPGALDRTVDVGAGAVLGLVLLAVPGLAASAWWTCRDGRGE